MILAIPLSGSDSARPVPGPLQVFTADGPQQAAGFPVLQQELPVIGLGGRLAGPRNPAGELDIAQATVHGIAPLQPQQQGARSEHQVIKGNQEHPG